MTLPPLPTLPPANCVAMRGGVMRWALDFCLARDAAYLALNTERVWDIGVRWPSQPPALWHRRRLYLPLDQLRGQVAAPAHATFAAHAALLWVWDDGSLTLGMWARRGVWWAVGDLYGAAQYARLLQQGPQPLTPWDGATTDPWQAQFTGIS